MKITLSRTALHRAAKLCAGTADTRGTMPQLACAHLLVDGDTLTVSATDLVVATRVTLTGTAAANGAAIVSAKDLADRVATLGDDVTIEVRDTALCLTSGRIVTRIPTLPAKDFPKLLKVATNGAKVPDPEALHLALSWCLTAAASDETRAHLCGVALIDGAAVATDGHRLHIVRGIAPGKGERIIPARGVSAILRTIAGVDEAVMAVADGLIEVRAADVSTTVKLVDAKFPPYEQVIPAMIGVIVVDKPAFHAAANRCRMVTGGAKGMKISASDGALHCRASGPERGDHAESIDVLNGDDAPTCTEVMVNPVYLVEALSSLEGVVELGTGGALDPLRIDGGDGWTAVVMPMRAD